MVVDSWPITRVGCEFRVICAVTLERKTGRRRTERRNGLMTGRRRAGIDRPLNSNIARTTRLRGKVAVLLGKVARLLAEVATLVGKRRGRINWCLARLRSKLSQHLAPGLGLSARPREGKIRFPFRFARRMCAEALETGAATIGLVPCAELDRLGLDYLPDLGIACEGPVRSILLISKRPYREDPYAGGRFGFAEFGGAGAYSAGGAIRMPAAVPADEARAGGDAGGVRCGADHRRSGVAY